MDVYRKAGDLRAVLDAARAQGQRVGMVGTSGGMHAGHMSLIERAAAENDVTSLFWGGDPGSFRSPSSSTISYRRDANHDFPLAEKAGAHMIFAPLREELFPRASLTKVTLPSMSSAVPHLEDPAHLDLIALAMCKLWNMFGPSRVYFGEKDWQQLVMFTRLADDLCYPVEVIGCPTIREDDGVAVSSRNIQLTAEERTDAPVLYRALNECRSAALAGTRSAVELTRLFGDVIGDSGVVRYFTAVEVETMTPLEELTGAVRMLGSIELGKVRLLDNLGVDL
jgi:pantoate--beta-alanine ligase